MDSLVNPKPSQQIQMDMIIAAIRSGSHTSSSIAAVTDLPVATVTRYLRAMRSIGLVASHSQGTNNPLFWDLAQTRD